MSPDQAEPRDFVDHMVSRGFPRWFALRMIAEIDQMTAGCTRQEARDRVEDYAERLCDEIFGPK
jgi:hypothetical protein